MTATTAWDFSAETIDGRPAALADHRGKVLLVVNTASQCGLTPQYAGLEALQRRFAARGFAVLGFPCNQFGGQEPGTGNEIRTFCETRFDVTFPMHAKVEVNGDGAHPLWQWMKSAAPGLLGSEAIKWNFTKFLIDRSGKVVRRFGPADAPSTIRNDIEALLSAPAS